MTDPMNDVRDRVRAGLPDAPRRRVFDDLVAGRPTVWVPAREADPAAEAAATAEAAQTPSGAPAAEVAQTPSLTPALIDAAEDRFR